MKLPLTGGCICGAVRYEITQAPVSVWSRCLEMPSRALLGHPFHRRRAAWRGRDQRQRALPLPHRQRPRADRIGFEQIQLADAGRHERIAFDRRRQLDHGERVGMKDVDFSRCGAPSSGTGWPHDVPGCHAQGRAIGWVTEPRGTPDGGPGATRRYQRGMMPSARRSTSAAALPGASAAAAY